MRRADRLFEIIQRLRRRRIVTAASLAEHFEVSERTLYRDIADLIASDVPIEGAAGVGYSLRKGYDLPPLMFSESELEALVFGARMVQNWSDDELGRAADAALSKIEDVLPAHLPDSRRAIAVGTQGHPQGARALRSRKVARGDSRLPQGSIQLSR